MIDDVMLEAEEKMEQALEASKRELASIRTGRANPSMFNPILVDYYGAPTPLQQLAGITIPEARTVIVSPYDRSAIKAITTTAHGAGEFYDYETKYLAHDAVQMVCPARITPAERELLMATASAAFDALGGEGLMRVDFFLTPRGEAVVNEVNTMPGFTPFSMYPYMWQVSGLGYTELVTELIDLALERPRDVNR